MLRSLTKVAFRKQQRAAWPAVSATARCYVNNKGPSVRFFSRRSRDELDEQEEEIMKATAATVGPSSPSAVEMEFYSQLASDFDEAEEEDEDTRLEAEYRRKQEEIQKELDSRTGRAWTDPWEISQEQWTSTQLFDDLPDWAPEYVSRVSQERVKLHPDGIPTLAAIATMALPTPACPHPGLGKAKSYAAYRKMKHAKYVAKLVVATATPKIDKILKLQSWEEKQDAVDELFEGIESELRAKEEILGKHPKFGEWVSGALEELLTKIKEGGVDSIKVDEYMEATVDPVFMDCFSSEDDEEAVVPAILRPLKPHPRDGPGRMAEEWELAANKKTKRILLRECTQHIAAALENKDSSRVFVHGRRGVGKSAVLSSIVASSRKSGHVVLYLPDGDRMRKNGFYVTPNGNREGMFDLPDLSQEVCSDFLASHGADIASLSVDKDTMKKFFKDSQLERIPDFSGETIDVVSLLKHAAEKKSHAPMCFSAVVETMINQSDKKFIMVLDGFNCYHDRGHYFHMAYDKDVREPIPYDKINLFEHALAAIPLTTEADDEVATPLQIKNGGIVVGMTESHAVPRKTTQNLLEDAKEKAANDESMVVVEVPRFSDAEVDSILANFEAIGVGNLRLDRGDTVMDEQEIAYLKMVSGSVGQKLLDASVL